MRLFFGLFYDGSGPRQVHHRRYDGGNDDPEQLEPVEEGHADELWLFEVVEGRPEQDNEGEQ